jgi:hypothetical protein
MTSADPGQASNGRNIVANRGPTARCVREHDFALTVGVDHYPQFECLQGAVADAVAFHRWVCDPDGGAVDPARARLIASTFEPATPVQDQIDDELVQLMKDADASGGGRRLYFYFSGHGATSPDESGDDVALLLARWSRNLKRIALSSRGYSSALSGVGLFEELVIFLDCCRTATVRAVGRPPAITYEMASERCPTRLFIAHAAHAGRAAFERRQGERWQGVFTRCLLTILRRAPDGIDAKLLKSQLECEIREADTGQQAEVLNGLCDGARFGRRGVLPLLRIATGPGRGRIRLLNGVGDLVAVSEAEPGPWLVTTPAGLYKLVDQSGAQVLVDHGLREITDVAF